MLIENIMWWNFGNRKKTPTKPKTREYSRWLTERRINAQRSSIKLTRRPTKKQQYLNNACRGAAHRGEIVWHFNTKLQPRTMHGHRTPDEHGLHYSSAETSVVGGMGVVVSMKHWNEIFDIYFKCRWKNRIHCLHRLKGAERRLECCQRLSQCAPLG